LRPAPVAPVVRRLIAALLGAFVLVPLSLSPAAAQYPPQQVATIELDKAVVDCTDSESLTIAGRGFIPNEPFVRIFFDGDVIAEVFPDDEGSFTVTVDPPAAAAGEHTITAEQFVAPEEPDLITAFASVACQGGVGLAFTGRNLSEAVMLLLALLAVGAVAQAAGRRRAGHAA
jgi:hypothetical protein